MDTEKDKYYMGILAKYKEYEIAYKKDISRLTSSIDVFKKRDAMISQENDALKKEIDAFYLKNARLQEEVRGLWKVIQDRKIKDMTNNTLLEDAKKKVAKAYKDQVIADEINRQHHEDLYEETRANELAALKIRELAIAFMADDEEKRLKFVLKMTQDEHMLPFSSMESMINGKKREALYYIENNKKI